MPKPTGPTNPILKQMIKELKAAGHKYDVPFALAIAEKTGMPERKRAEVNLSTIDRYAENGGSVLVPGKVLAAGTIAKPVTVAAVKFSANAKAKIEKAGGKAMKIPELIKENPKGTGVKILC